MVIETGARFIQPGTRNFELEQRDAVLKERFTGSAESEALTMVVNNLRSAGFEDAIIAYHPTRGNETAVFAVRWDLEEVLTIVTALSSFRSRLSPTVTSKGVGVIFGGHGSRVVYSKNRNWKLVEEGETLQGRLIIAERQAKPIPDARFGRGKMSNSRIPVDTLSFGWINPSLADL